MDSGKTVLPLAMTVSSGSSGVSAPFSVLPEQWAGQTGALGHAMMQLFCFPTGGQRQAAEALTARLEGVTHSMEQIFQGANSPAQSANVAVAEAARTSIEQALQFCQDLAGASGPADAIGIQLAYLQSQAKLFAQQVQAIQREVSRLLVSYGPN